MAKKFYLGRVFESPKTDEAEMELRRAMAELTDDLNSRLDGFEVTLVHLNGEDYFVFQPEPAE